MEKGTQLPKEREPLKGHCSVSQASEAVTGKIFQSCGKPAGHPALRLSDIWEASSLETTMGTGAGTAPGWECQLLPGGPRRASWRRWPLVGLTGELDRMVFHLLSWSYVV